MSESTYTITLTTEGLTLKEVRQLQNVLASIDGVQDIRLAPPDPASPRFTANVGEFRLLVTAAKPVLAVGAAVLVDAAHAFSTAFFTKLAENLATEVNEWLHSKLSGKSSVQVKVKMYGADGELIKEESGKR